MSLSLSFFAISIVGITLLFALKWREMKASRIYFPGLRDRADVQAIRLKHFVFQGRFVLESLPPVAMIFLRSLIHEIALLLATLARLGEAQAHRLADLVSHKHRFQRGETRSEFLKRVAQHKEEIVHEEQSLFEDGGSAR